MTKKISASILLLILIKSCIAQPTLSNSIIKAKQGEKERLLKNIAEAFRQPIADTTYLQYQSAFWAMMYLEHKPKTALLKLKFALKNFSKYEVNFQNALLEVVYSQYPKEVEKEIIFLIKDTSITAKQFAVCGEYLLRLNKKYADLISLLYDKRNENVLQESKEYLYLAAFRSRNKNYLFNKEKSSYLKEIIESIFTNKFLPSKSIVISLQNKNRNYPGIVIIKDSIGNILKFNDTIFHTQQLTRSITNLPYYISNGNTPQGIFRINGFGISKNSHIGPTDNFQLCMPYECDVKAFFDEVITDSIWTDSIYEKLLPEVFLNKEYRFLQEAAIAGKLGRYEIISHGSTVNPLFYKGKSYEGFTPTMGCLQAKEVWDYKTGKRIYSDQQKLIDAYKSIGAEKGYLIVLDIIDANRPVNINDFKALLK